MRPGPAPFRQVLAVAALVTGCTLAGGAGASIPKEQHRTESNKAQAMYKNAWDGCKRLQGNARDVCKAEAKGTYEVAKAELAAQLKPTPKRDDEVRTEKAKAAYRLAVQKCGDLKSNAKDVCVKDARTSYVAAQGATRISRAAVDRGVNSRKAVTERKDAREDDLDAQYAAAKERCEGMSGDAKASCVGDARRKFGKL